MKDIRLRSVLVLFVLSVCVNATATTIDFSTLGPTPMGGDLLSSSYMDPGTGLIVQGYYFNDITEKWSTTGAGLYARNQTNDHGLGVCSPSDRESNGECPGPDGGGDFNELDNEDARELIRLELPAGYEWVSVQLSSLDTNGNLNISEFGRLYANMDGDPDTIGAVLEEFQGGVDPIEALLFIPASSSTARYLFFEPIDWASPTTNPDNNDFLVYQATIERRRVFEPGTLGVLGIGLVALGRLRRRR